MSEFTNYLEERLLSHFFRAVASTAPATVYVGLYTAAADAEAGTFTEVVGAVGYARVAVTFGAPAQVSGKAQCANSADVTYAAATGAGWGTVVGFFIADAAAAGNIFCYSLLDNSVAVNAGSTVKFAAGDLIVEAG